MFTFICCCAYSPTIIHCVHCYAQVGVGRSCGFGAGAQVGASRKLWKSSRSAAPSIQRAHACAPQLTSDQSK